MDGYIRHLVSLLASHVARLLTGHRQLRLEICERRALLAPLNAAMLGPGRRRQMHSACQTNAHSAHFQSAGPCLGQAHTRRWTDDLFVYRHSRQTPVSLICFC